MHCCISPGREQYPTVSYLTGSHKLQQVHISAIFLSIAINNLCYEPCENNDSTVWEGEASFIFTLPGTQLCHMPVWTSLNDCLSRGERKHSGNSSWYLYHLWNYLAKYSHTITEHSSEVLFSPGDAVCRRTAPFPQCSAGEVEHDYSLHHLMWP